MNTVQSNKTYFLKRNSFDERWFESWFEGEGREFVLPVRNISDMEMEEIVDFHEINDWTETIKN